MIKNMINSEKEKGKLYWIRKCTAILVIIAMVATCVQTALTNDSSDVVSAAGAGESITSLSAIEELKENVTSSTDQTYTIYEVVPVLGTGSMGYWVPGEETLSYYTSSDTASSYFVDEYNLATTVGSSARKTAVSVLITNLTGLGLLSTDDSTALTTADYAEYIEGLVDAEDIPEEAVEIDLITENPDGTTTTRTEEIEVSGTFEYSANKTGDFNQESNDATLTINGEYVQNVEMFLYGEDAAAAIADGTVEFAFYYQPTFTRIDFSFLSSETEDGIDSSEYEGRAIYTKDSTSGRYKYEGSLGVEGFSLNVSSEDSYYWVEPGAEYGTGDTAIAPTDSTNASNTSLYLAVGDFLEAEDDQTGYFDVDNAFVYVGENQGNFSYNSDVAGTTTTIKYSTVYVNPGFTNNNWFRRFVLGDDTTSFEESFKIEVIEILASDLTMDIIDNEADLVVFSSGFSLDFTDVRQTLSSEYGTSNDISEDVLTELVLRIEDEGYKTLETPMIIDGNLQEYINTTVEETTIGVKVGSNGQTTYTYPDDVTKYYTSSTIYDSALTNLATLINLCAEELMDEDDVSDDTVSNTVESNNGGGYNKKYTTTTTTTTTYDYSNINSCGSAEGGLYYVSQGDSLVTRNIIGEFSDNSSDYYTEVSDTITYENFLRETTGAGEVLTDEDAQINIATSIRHILMVGNQISASQKTTITVLEIQPDNSSDDNNSSNDEVLDEDQVKAWFPGVEEVIIDRMPVYEFIGKIDDITEVYDVIYIGADFGTLNTTTSGGETIVNYNDNDMDGLFYTNIGDTYEVQSSTSTGWLVGLLNSDYETTSGAYLTVGSYYALNSNVETTYRFSGNDITTTKLEELMTFVDTGLPVVISDRLISDDSVDITRVDQASYMYNFLDYAIDEPNVYTLDEIVDNTDMATQYLNLTKPEIVFADGDDSKPTEYSGDLSKSLVEDNTVSYTFSISNETDATPEETVYSVSLYIDQDADGTYEANEQLSELVVKDSDGNVVSEDELKVNVEYTVEKILPDSYIGAIPWKLEISIVDREEFHTSEVGYTYIKPGTPVVINILQILDDDGKATSTKGNLLTVNEYYSQYIDEVKDVYDINVEGISINDLNALGEDEAFAKLNEYDMIILGFGDGYGKYSYNEYGGLSEESALAVESFINTGKAVLFTHDTTYSINLPSSTYPTFTTDSKTTSVWVDADKTKVTYALAQNIDGNLVDIDEWIIDQEEVADILGYDDIEVMIECIAKYGRGKWSAEGATSLLEFGVLEVGENSSGSYFNVTDENYKFYQQFILEDVYYDVVFDETTGPTGYYVTETVETGTISNTGTSIYESWYTGYYFNTVLRDSIGLDRYGITDSEYRSIYSSLSSAEYFDSGDAFVANGYVSSATGSEITATEVQEILDSGYSIAYEPTTESYDGTVSYTTETQGYTKNAIFFASGYASSSQLDPVANMTNYISDDNTRVETISQVNKGQITTFPYDVNTEAFDDSTTSTLNTLSVEETHYQYYQLNMNSDDVVVWYCLSGGIYDDYPNDVVNTYYIYNIGNVTYSGAGHTDVTGDTEYTDTAGVTASEAQLFVNTMIAAYRAGRAEPEITLVDENGAEFSAVYFTVDEALETSLAGEEGVGDSEKLIPFTITDTNLENPDIRTISISYYEGGITAEEAEETTTTREYNYDVLEIYNSSGGKVTDTSKLLTNTSYTVEIPDDIITDFIESDLTSFTIYINISSTFADSETLPGDSVSITLYKLGLQNLN